MKNSTILVFLLSISLTGRSQINFKWETLNANTSKNINDIYFHTSELGYIVGDNYLFKKTTDGGKTWVDLTPPAIGERPGNNGNLVGIGFHTSFSFSTLDSGLYLTWEKGYHGVSTHNEGGAYKVFSYPDSNQFCNASGFSVLPALRGNGYVNLYTYGQNCKGKAIYNNYYNGPFSIQVSDSVNSIDSGKYTTVAADSFSTIFGHDDGYLRRYPFVTSKPDSIYLDSFGVTSVAYAGNHTWYAATASGRNNMYVSYDSGKTFVLDATFPRTFHYPVINEMSFLSPNIGVIAATSNGQNGVVIIKDSSNWFFLTAPHPLHAAKLFANGVAYVAGDNGLIMRSGDRDTTIGLEEMQGRALQVFPNPTTDKLYVTGLKGLNVQSIRLLNLSGIEVKSFTPLNHELDVGDVPNGIYLLEVVVDGQRLTRRVIKHPS
ncbi:MAG: hypothetical protein CL840_00295 [Crocinitomicaceae bacterium]|nr:hypothetical protein [Crocinitomicaceae bacterium]|tara:strand:+ start:9434 stop:10729 length:1296 start_codon:yes stop_codon:yes gene_type:complete